MYPHMAALAGNMLVIHLGYAFSDKQPERIAKQGYMNIITIANNNGDGSGDTWHNPCYPMFAL